MSIRDAAQATGLSPKALRRRIERGTLASVMIAGRRRIPMEALARRGLIPLEPAALSVSRPADRRDPAEWASERLARLEARVSALESTLAETAVRATSDPASRESRAAAALANGMGRADGGRSPEEGFSGAGTSRPPVVAPAPGRGGGEGD